MRRLWSTPLRVVAPAVCAAILVGALAAPAGAAARPQQTALPESQPPKSFIVVNESNGAVLNASNEHEALPPASIAKIVTALAAVERLGFDATINVSELAAAQPASRINMVAGNQWRFEDALASLMMVSANDAAYAIAETAGGDLQGFSDSMNAMAERMKMQDSTFSDPAGLDDAASFGGGPRTSAFDIAIATRNALAVPEISKWASLRNYEFDDPLGAHRTLLNHNKMLPEGTRAYLGSTGFKTGYTKQAGNTLVVTAKRDNCSLIVVVMDTWDTYTWASTLLDAAFAANCAGGNGVHLPEVAVSPYQQRVDDREAFVSVAAGANTTTTVATTVPPSTLGPTTPTSIVSEVDADTAQLVADTESAGSGGGGLFSLRNMLIVVVIVLAGLFVLRRRAVKRQRARRMAARRTRAAQIRSGALPVVDDRYRGASRRGTPVESHVSVHRISRDER